MFAQKLLDLLKQPEPISRMPVTLHHNGALEVHVEQYLSSPQGRAELYTAQLHWQHWRRQREQPNT